MSAELLGCRTAPFTSLHTLAASSKGASGMQEVPNPWLAISREPMQYVQYSKYGSCSLQCTPWGCEEATRVTERKNGKNDLSVHQTLKQPLINMARLISRKR